MVVSLRDLVMSHEKIYSLLYSPCRIESDPIEKQIVEISTKSLRWSDDGTMFVYVWGCLGRTLTDILHRHMEKAGHLQNKKSLMPGRTRIGSSKSTPCILHFLK